MDFSARTPYEHVCDDLVEGALDHLILLQRIQRLSQRAGEGQRVTLVVPQKSRYTRLDPESISSPGWNLAD